ncbi:MAG: GNAT family N-acetyltransferase, partial [Pseudomonadota bacterium]
MLALGVRSARQGQGLGGTLVAALESQLRSAQQRMLIVETSALPDFAQARGFYAAQGYGKEAMIRDYWAAGDGKVIFRKLL